MLYPIYVLDANVFIEAKKTYYAFDINPGFWLSLIELAKQTRVCSIDRIKKEIEDGKDELASWVAGEFAFAFAKTDGSDIQNSYSEIINWVYAQPQFSDAVKSGFANDPDGWLVAYGKSRANIIVTLEKLRPDVKRKVPIPIICQAFNIPFVDTFEMLRRFGVQFVQYLP